MSAAACAYLRDDGAFTLLDEPTSPPTGTAVLICPPFGWEAVAARRPLRDWAHALAARGHITLRLDLPGSGDSAGGPDDRGLWESWRAAAGAAARLLAARDEVKRVAAIGIGLGGLVLIESIAAGAPIECAALWATPARGRVLLRELQAFARFERSALPQKEPVADGDDDDDGLAVAGYRLSAETMEALGRADLRELAAGSLAGRSVLLLESDGRRTDPDLAAALRSAGAQVDGAQAGSFSQLVAEPQLAALPTEAEQAVAAWLEHRSPAAARDPVTPPATGAELQLPGGGSERPVQIGSLFGILATPDGDAEDLCLVFLNAGVIDHCGPNRLWVRAARAWAARGVSSLRVDLEGIGESDGDASVYRENDGLHTERLVGQVLTVIDELAARGSGRRFAVVGLCSGAYWGFHAACADRRIEAVVMINPRALIWNEHLDAAREARRAGQMVRAVSWEKLRHSGRDAVRLAPWAARALTRQALAARHRRSTDSDPLQTSSLSERFERLRENGTQLLALFTGEEPLHEELQSGSFLAGEHGGDVLRVRVLSAGPAHTLRPPWLQRLALEQLDREITSLTGGTAAF